MGQTDGQTDRRMDRGIAQCSPLRRGHDNRRLRMPVNLDTIEGQLRISYSE